MNTPTLAFSLPEHIGQLVPNVFETMLNWQVSPAAASGPINSSDRVSGTVGVAGETVTGAVYVHLPEPLAREIVRTMLGSPPDEPLSESDLNDVVGEITNMIGGGLKSALCNADRPCAISTPSIIRGEFEIEVPQDLKAEKFRFRSQDQYFTVEIHLKLD